MRPDQYIRQATAYIADPVRAEDARRELNAHLAEAVEAGLAAGLERDEAEAEAVLRMGDPGALSWELAVSHHRHLPWRIYLITPLVGLLWVHLPLVEGRNGGLLWVVTMVVLGVSLARVIRAGRNPLVTLRVDVRAKRLWVSRNATRPAILAGAAAGILTALFSLLTEVWYGLVRQSSPITLLNWLGPALLAVALAAVFRTVLHLHPKVVVGIAILAFPFALITLSLLLYLSPWLDLAAGPSAWLLKSSLFTSGTLGLWSMTDRAERPANAMRPL